MLFDNIHILVLPSAFPTANHLFPGNFNRDHINVIKRTGASVEVIYVDFGNSNSSYQTQNYRFNHSNIRFKKRRILYPYYFVLWFVKISRCFLKKRPNLIIAYSQKWGGFIAGIISVVTNVPLVLVNHAVKTGNKYTFRRFIDSFLVWAAEYIWFVSPIQESCFKDIFQVPLSLVIGNPIDTEFYVPLANKPKDKTKILFVGRPSYNKGIDILIESVKALRKRHFDFTLTIVGDIALLPNEHRYFLGEPDVTILPYLPRDEYRDEIQSSSFIALPSRYESFSLVLAEAISCGKPVVSTKCGGPEWFVKEGVGILCKPNDVESFSEGLVYMLQNYQNYDPWFLHQHIVERFSYDVMKDKMINCISGILNK